jgi:hypothetical protein
LVLGIWTPCQGHCPNLQVSTEPGQLQYDLVVKDSHLRVVTPAKQMFDLDEHVCVDFSWDSAFAFDKQTEAC